MNKHTPGPWRLSDDGIDWQITPAGATFSFMGNSTYYPWVPTNKADWVLIAAAPELLEALRYARRWLNPIDHDVGFVDAVIAKATGAEQ